MIVTADTLRADKLASYGNRSIATPRLDELAASGVLFENAATAAPSTLPSHASIFTGTYPLYHGVRDNSGYYIEPEQITLAETLEEQGYATGAFVAAFVLDSRWGLDQGFARYFDDFHLSQFQKAGLDAVYRRGDEVLEEAFHWMDSVRDRPFFSWIHLYDTHTPYEPPEPFRSRYIEAPNGLYDGEVAFVDHLVGELMDWLEAKALLESTIVVFVSDHGESLGDHGERTHAYFIYDSTMHVPFILKAPFPGFRGRRVESQVRTIDLMPTVLELLGVEIPAPVQGQSLVSLATGREDDLGLVAYGESNFPRYHYGWGELLSLRTSGLHYIHAPRPELYDVRADPREETNLASRRAGTIRRFEEQLEEIRASHNAEAIDEKQPIAIDSNTRARLEALGYVGAGVRVAVDPSQPLVDPKDKIGLVVLIEEAMKDADEGLVSVAIAKIQRVLARDPDIPLAENILGDLHGVQGEPGKATAAYKRALARAPQYKAALFSLAETYKEMGRLDAAMAGFQRVLALEPRDSRASFMLAQIHIERENFVGALELLEGVLFVGSERAELHNLMAQSYRGLGQLDNARAEIQRALELRPDLSEAHGYLARIRESRGDLEGAVEAYEKELELSPESFQSHFNIANLYSRMGRSTETIEHLEKTIELNPEFVTGYLYLANAYLEQGALQEAQELATRGIELEPEPGLAPFGHFILADVYERLGRDVDAAREMGIAKRLAGSLP